MKRIRGNQRPFMTKELRNVVMNQSKTRNKYIKLALDIKFVNFINYKLINKTP